MTLGHRAWIPYHFGDSPTSCPDPLLFQRLFEIMLGFPPIVSAALWHRVRIPYRFRRFFDIVLGSPIISVTLRHSVRIPYCFNGSPNVPECPPIVSETLRHCARISYLFDGSLASCLDPVLFQWLFDIVSRSSIISVTLRHRVGIPYCFNGSSAS